MAVSEAAARNSTGTGSLDYVSNPAELPQGTLVDLFLDAVDRRSARAQLYRTDAGWQPVSHDEMLHNVRAIAAAVRTRGLQRGDHVGILAENRPEWAWVDYALLCAGIITVPLYPTLPAPQAAGILEHSGVKLLFVSTADQLAKVRSLQAQLPDLDGIIVFDDVPVEDGSVETLRDFMDGGAASMPSDAEFRAEAKRARPADLATLIYTSGTTGDPKGVMLTHANLYSNIIASTKHVLTTEEGDATLSFLPLSHVFQRMVDYLIFGRGNTIAYVPIIDDVARALREVKPTIVVAVPRVYEKLYAKVLSVTGVQRRIVLWARQVALDWAALKLRGAAVPAGLRAKHAIADRLVYSKLRARLGGRIRFFVSGAAPLSPQIFQFFYGARVLILEGYGLTETSPVTNVNTPTKLRIGTVGTAIPGTEIRIAQDGEILVRGPQVMKGYYRNDAATREMIDAEGWLHTGDIGAIDADGFLSITDRKKELLVTAGGKNIAPQPIQNAAKLSRFVAEAVLIGDRRPFPIMLVVPNFDALEEWARREGLSTEDHAALVRDSRVREKLEQEVAARMTGFARYELPKKVLPLEREFSLERGEITPSLKVRRKVVVETYGPQIEALYAEPAPPEKDAE
ncbi:MAG TPA: long-chain fatty acid--CoA ligase [Longimicrobiales bacterium]|nr:long-chain fatty acid--CoA ligase [Longimicrobiales bacterium]